MFSDPGTTRRKLLSAGVLAGTATLLGVRLAAAADRPNPMPEELRDALERDPASPVLGNPQGDITLTEFFDYNCPFCRKMVPTIQKLISGDPQLRVVFHEVPVFGEGSEFAARASLAALRQNKYWPFHAAMMAIDGKADAAATMAVADRVGLDQDRLRADMDSPAVSNQIARSMQLFDHLGLMGTPAFVAGDEGLFGYQDRDDLRGLIARARTTLG